jgi:signal transduction histidine kinase
MGFYTPSGFNLGEIKSDGKFSEGGNISLKETKEGMTRTADDNLILMQKIPAAVQNCCECKTKNIVGGDEGYFYWLKTNISTKPFQATMASIREKVLLLLFAIFLIGFFLSKKITSKLTSRLDQVSAAMDKVTNEEDLSTRLNFKGKDEIADIGRRFDGMVEALSESRSKQLEAERHRSFSEMARRVGHDIKSPIAALNTAVQSDQTLSEQSRILVRGAISRIREITSGLYSRPHLSTADQFSYQSIDDHVTGETQVFALGPIVEAICDEKRANLFNRPSLSIDLDMENNGYGIFGRINSSEFKRVISSLLDNSVEAMDKMAGHIEIKISRKKGKIQISISDDGNGIPENIKSKVFHRGFTYGKKEGSGLGLYYAKKVIESWGGNLTLDSEIRTGTEITIKLPEPKPPLWYVDQISTQGIKKIIVIDDDQTIHTVWEQIFKNIDTKISLEHFYGFKEAEQWLNAMELGGEALSEVLLLSDFEIRNEIENGFEFLKRRKLFDRSILVTSYSDDQKLIARCLKLGCKMIPKNLAAHVPIKLDG